MTKVGLIFITHTETQRVWFEKKEEEAPRKFKNEHSTGQMMLTGFWDRHALVFTEFGPDTPKEK